MGSGIIQLALLETDELFISNPLVFLRASRFTLYLTARLNEK
jgi:hypothetical protein